ncbi:MAG: DnaA regulatory inactivator Hda [Pseudomonadota bacterium]
MSTQLLLGVRLREHAHFDTYQTGDSEGNALALALCESMSAGGGERQLYLHAPDGLGKTHLLQATCAAASARHRVATYVPLEQVSDYGPEVLEGLEQLNVVCLDNVHSVAGEAHWEEALFHLINRCRHSDARLVMSSTRPPAGHDFVLPDLRSRLGWGPVIALEELSQAQKRDWLQQRAGMRGFDVSDEAADYLLRHYPRSMRFLVYALDELDRVTLQKQRKVTVPLLRQELSVPESLSLERSD